MNHTPGRPDAHQQLDLFGGERLWGSPAAATPGSEPPRPNPVGMDDASLLGAIPEASSKTCRDLALEAARRGLEPAIPALETLCRRVKGFGSGHAIPEQEAALHGLRAIGGRAAAQAVARLITNQAVIGPGLVLAAEIAAHLGAQMPSAVVIVLLRHPEPPVRGNACRLAGSGTEETTLLIDLLGDLHPPVAAAAACALGRRGRIEARHVLVHLLGDSPSVEVIEAMAGVADDDALVRLGQLARARPDLADAVIAALDDLDEPRAAVIAGSVRRFVSRKIGRVN